MTIDKNYDKMKTKNNIWGENMKKLKCKSCLNIWYVDDYRLNDQKYCPCCCAKITKEVSLGEIDTPPKAIYDYIMQYGIDELKNPESLVNYLNDMCPDMKKEIRLLSRAFRDYRREIFKLFKAELSETDNLLNSLKDDLINYDEMSEQGADIICENLNGAVMLYKGKNLPVVMSVEVSDVSDISEETESKTFEEEQPEEKDYSQSEIIDSGKCGDNAEWTFYRDGTFVINGSGDMYNYNCDFDYGNLDMFDEENNDYDSNVINVTTEWYNYREYIKQVEIKDGITSIGVLAFCGCSSIKKINLPEGLRSIGQAAFNGCEALTSLTLPKSVQTMGKNEGVCSLSTMIVYGLSTFSGCISLKTIKIPIKVKRYMSDWQENWKGDCNAEIVYI